MSYIVHLRTAAFTCFIALLLLGTHIPHARAAAYDERLNSLSDQLGLISEMVSIMQGAYGEVRGAATTGRITALRAQVAAYTEQIKAITARRDAAQKELDALTVSAAQPTCTLTSDRKVYALGDVARFSWTTTNATQVSFVPDTSGKDNLVPPPGLQTLKQGTVEVPVTVLGSPFLVLSALGDKEVRCTATITVTASKNSSNKGEYRGYMAPSVTPFITTKDITRPAALANCALNQRKNPTKKVWCTWNDEVIMGTKPEAVVPAQTPVVIVEPFTVSAKSVTPGQSVTFAWKSNLTATDMSYYGGSCSIQGLTQDNRQLYVFGPAQVSSGSVSFVPPMTAAYTIFCSSNAKDGSPSDSASIVVEVASATATGPVAEFIGTTETLRVHPTTQSLHAGVYTIKFDVVAADSDVYIKTTAARSEAKSGLVFNVLDQNGRIITIGTTSAALSSTASLNAGYYEVNEGEAETFTLTVMYDPATSGAYKVAASLLMWSETPLATASVQRSVMPMTEFSTKMLII